MSNCKVPVYIGLGSNLDNPAEQLRQAIEYIKQLPESNFLKLSNIYRTTPIGPVDQPDYLNAATLIETLLSPVALLDRLQRIEKQQQRVRNIHWGPRTIDLDILLFNQLVTSTSRLTIPHPEIYQRSFVLIPLADINPQLVFPDGTSLSEKITNIEPQQLELFACAEEFLAANF